MVQSVIKYFLPVENMLPFFVQAFLRIGRCKPYSA